MSLRHFTTTRNGKPYRQFATDAADMTAAGGKLVGYAMKWDVLSLPGYDGYRVRLARGSAILDPEVFALWHHDYRAILATTANGSLKLTADEIGLRVEITPADTQAGRDTLALVNGGYVRGMSFGMHDWVSTLTEGNVEVVTSFGVDEVTITGTPRFTQTEIGPAPAPKPAAYARDLKGRSLLDRARLHQFSQ